MTIYRRLMRGIGLSLMGGWVLCLVACETGSADIPEDWLARVDDTTLTRQDLDLEIRLLSGDTLQPEAGTPERVRMERSVLDDLVDRAVLLAEARRRHIVVAPEEVQERVADLLSGLKRDEPDGAAAETIVDPAVLTPRMENLLRVENLFSHDVYPRILIKDDELTNFLETQGERYKQPETVWVRQIVVATEDEADAARRRIYRGEPFHKVASELSIMPERDRGGDLGHVHRGSLPDPFGELVFELPRGVISKPIKSSYGYHVFLITDHRPARLPDADSMRRLARRDLFALKKQEAERNLIESLRRRTTIKLNPAFQSKETFAP